MPTLVSVLLVATVVTGVEPAQAQDNACVVASSSAADAMAAGRWQDATEILQASIRRSACAGVATEQMFSLAYATEQLVPEAPDRACEAEKLYGAVLARNPEPQFTEGARKGQRRMKALCNRCLSARDASADGDWARAERLLRADLALESCASERPRLRFELAEAVEQRVVDDPRRACEAQNLYQAAAEVASSQRDARRAGAGAARMKLLCDRRPVAAGPADPGSGGATPAPPPADAPDRTTAWLTTIGAGVAVVAGGAMVYGSVLQQDEWEDALRDRQTAHASGDTAGVADAEARFEDAASLGPTLNVVGWSAIGVGVGLGALATWLWVDAPEVEATISPGGASVMVRF